MTATVPHSYKWISSARTRSAYRSVYELLREDAPEADVKALFEALTKIRGAHRVEIRPTSSTAGTPEFRSVSFRGTDRAQVGAANAIAFSGIRETDRNADHDHAACIAHARSLGVPASWAHQPETYLSM